MQGEEEGNVSKMGLEEWVQMATHILKAGSEEGDISEIGLDKPAWLATHMLKVQWDIYENNVIKIKGNTH